MQVNEKIGNEKIFEVDQIVCRRERKGKEEYLVYWKGFDISSATWEPVDNLLSCADLIEQFQRQTRPIPGSNPYSLVHTEKTKKIHVKMLLNRKRTYKSRSKAISTKDVLLKTNSELNDENNVQNTPPLTYKKKLTEGEKLIRDTLVHESKTMSSQKTSLNRINDILNCYDNPPPKTNGVVNGNRRSYNRSTNRSRDTGANNLVLTEVKKDYLQLTLNNTARHNLLTISMLDTLSDSFQKARKNNDIKAVLLRNNGDYFCDGIDYSELMVCSDEKEYKNLVHELVAAIRHFLEVMFTFTKPIVCAINGPTSEFGMALVTSSDLAYSTSKASFELLYNKLSLTPIGCLTQMLPKIVGHSMANSMLYIGGRYSAVSASDRGLILDMYGVNSFTEDMDKKMAQLTSNSAQVLESTKKLLKHLEPKRLEEISNAELDSYQLRLLTKEFKQKLHDDWTMLINLYSDI